MKTALLVIDAQRIYTKPDSELYSKDSKATIKRINRLVRAFMKEGNPIIFVRHIHKSDASDLGRMFDYAGDFEDFNFKEGTKEVEYDNRLVRPAKPVEIIKNRYSAFMGTNLDDVLRKLQAERLVICGFMTNFCCDSTTREAHDRDYYVDFIVDATGTPGLETLNEKAVRKAVAEMLESGYACVYSTDQYLRRLR